MNRGKKQPANSVLNSYARGHMIVVVFKCLSQNCLCAIDARWQNLENSFSGFYDLQPKLFWPRGYPTAELIDMYLNYSISADFLILMCTTVTFSLTDLSFVNFMIK